MPNEPKKLAAAMIVGNCVGKSHRYVEAAEFAGPEVSPREVERIVCRPAERVGGVVGAICNSFHDQKKPSPLFRQMVTWFVRWHRPLGPVLPIHVSSSTFSSWLVSIERVWILQVCPPTSRSYVAVNARNCDRSCA